MDKKKIKEILNALDAACMNTKTKVTDAQRGKLDEQARSNICSALLGLQSQIELLAAAVEKLAEK